MHSKYIHTPKLLLTIFAILSFNFAFSQQFHRFSAEYTIKYNDKAGNPLMRMGKIFYDKNEKQIVIKNGFPVKEYIIHKDTSIYYIRVGNIVKHIGIIAPVEFSIFHLALNNELSNFGLDKAGYTIGAVKKEKGLVMTSWIPSKKHQQKLGEILISTKEKKLFGVIFMDLKGKMLSKHLFHKYVKINGFEFPSEIARINYIGNSEQYELTTYRKIKVNETGNDNFYKYPISEK